MSLIHLMTLGAGVPVRETVYLNGSSGSPVSQIFSGSSDSSNIVWGFCFQPSIPNNITDQDCLWAGYDTGDLAVYTYQHALIRPIPFAGTYWIRASLHADTSPNWVSSNAMDTWISLGASNVLWGWNSTTFDVVTGTIKVEIADGTPQDSNIIETGYYKGSVNAEDLN